MSATVVRFRWWPWLVPLITAGIGLAALLVLFAPEVRAAVGVWQDSTAYGHCFLVLPIVIWLVWERRTLLVPLQPRPWPVAALLALPCGAVWLVAERLGLMEGRQLAALASVWVLVLALFGARIVQAMASPLVYLVFLVPSGAFLVPALQGFTARFIDAGLDLLAIPHVVDQVVIDVPEGRFLVAEACAGLRFLIATIAFGVLYAVTIYRSPWRRFLFIAVSVAVPVLANGVRALGIVLLGHLRGSAQAGAVDHVLYGWLFFSLIIALLILLGLPFREDGLPYRPRSVPSAGPPARWRSLAALSCTLVLAGVAPGTAWCLDRLGASASAPPSLARLAPPEGCRRLPDPAQSEQRFSCGPVQAEVSLRRFKRRSGAAPIQAAFGAADRLVEADEVEHSNLATATGSWRLSRSDVPEAAVAAALWREGHASPGGFSDRLALAEASLFGGGREFPLVSTVYATGPGAETVVQDLAERVGALLAGALPAGNPG